MLMSSDVVPIHPIVVGIIQSGPKWWTDRTTNIAIFKATVLAWLKRQFDINPRNMSFTKGWLVLPCLFVWICSVTARRKVWIVTNGYSHASDQIFGPWDEENVSKGNTKAKAIYLKRYFLQSVNTKIKSEIFKTFVLMSPLNKSLLVRF